MTAPLRVGVAFPHSVHSGLGSPNWPDLKDLAVSLETAGFDGLWVSDHFSTDLEKLGGPPGFGSQLDALVLLPALAVVTERVTLGTLVLAVGFRPPSVLAKAAASLDCLSEGRFDLGLGAGWDEAEYTAAGLPFPSPGDRLAQLEEAVILIRSMVAGGRTTVTGRHFRVDDAPNSPPAHREPFPILVAASGPRALRTVARTADAWNVAWRYSPEEYSVLASRFEQACEAEGRDPKEIRRSLGLMTLVGEDETDLRRRFEIWRGQAPWLLGDAPLTEVAKRALVGTPEQINERIEEFRAFGVTDLVLSFSPLPFGWSFESGWDIVADQILPAYRGTPR